jgi:hypothetical protein
MGKVIHASGSGYFPQCIRDYHIGIFSLEEAMKIYWRVRSWQFSASITTENEFGIFSGNTSFSVLSTANKEEDLVCSNSFYGSIDYLQGSPSVQIIFNPQVYKNINTYIGFGVGVSLYGLPTIPPFSFYVTQFYSDASYNGNYEATILGKQIKLKGAEDYTGILSLSLVLSPSAYWSYGGTYDITTGQLL